MQAKIMTVLLIPERGITKGTSPGIPRRFSKMRKNTFENTIPKPRPKIRHTAAVRIVSVRMTPAMCRFSMPRMLYSPSSFLRRFIRKLLV